MRVFVCSLCMLLTISLGKLFGQTNYVDSLKKELETAIIDTVILNLNLELSKHFSILPPGESAKSKGTAGEKSRKRLGNNFYGWI